MSKIDQVMTSKVDELREEFIADVRSDIHFGSDDAGMMAATAWADSLITLAKVEGWREGVTQAARQFGEGSSEARLIYSLLELKP